MKRRKLVRQFPNPLYFNFVCVPKSERGMVKYWKVINLPCDTEYIHKLYFAVGDRVGLSREST